MNNKTAKKLNKLAEAYRQPKRKVKRIWNSIPSKDRNTARLEVLLRLSKADKK